MNNETEGYFTERAKLILYLNKNPDSKAKFIARDFNTSTTVINRMLYKNSSIFEMNEAYEWRLRDECQPKSQTPSQGADTDNLSTAKGPISAAIEEVSWDVHQRTVIEINESEYRLIEAGPGSGKTAVACARVAHLIEYADLEASKILLISFTRTAIKELRERIQSYAENPESVVGVQMCTLDSFTWQALSGTSDEDREKLFYSYDENLSSFLEKLRARDPVILDYLDEFEHVLIDEGQDLVGARSELIIELIKNLNEICGVSVFADSAQAIYGFTMEHGSKSSSQDETLLAQLNESDLPGFEQVDLMKIYRTKDERLIKLFLEGRKLLKDGNRSKTEKWKSIKSFIESCAHDKCSSPEKEKLSGQSGTLVLYRTKAEVLMNSAYLWREKVQHKLRLSGAPSVIYPWIGRIFSSFVQDYINFETFSNRWSELVGLDSLESKQAWEKLVDVVGLSGGKISIAQLREVLKRDRPPIDILVDEQDFEGPVLSTIHSSKGREADKVHLMLPADDFIDSNNDDFRKEDYEIEEECRVLYVGATRAKKVLKVGLGNKTFASTLKSGRVFKWVKTGKNKKMVQIGIAGDINYSSVVNPKNTLAPKQQQGWLWSRKDNVEKLHIIYCQDTKRSELRSEAEDVIALMSTNFTRELFDIGKRISKNVSNCKGYPQQKIKYVKMIGVTTVVIPEAQRSQLPEPWCHSGIILAPVISGFPTINFH
ncbi:MAG: UvrD-helicase domain-containing protein [Balneolia bacterium]|nr:UvrD-helicase domain-containing protein [Balneolia bacterium]